MITLQSWTSTLTGVQSRQMFQYGGPSLSDYSWSEMLLHFNCETSTHECVKWIEMCYDGIELKVSESPYFINYFFRALFISAFLPSHLYFPRYSSQKYIQLSKHSHSRRLQCGAFCIHYAIFLDCNHPTGGPFCVHCIDFLEYDHQLFRLT